jgi:broad specificity phosphatase PhoE
MATVILVRHGRTTANATGILAGRTPGVDLDDTGRDQADRAGDRLAAVPLAAVVSSPLQRCWETAQRILERQQGTPPQPVDPDLTECDYGVWQGRPLSELATEDLWKTVQAHDAAIEAEHGPGAVWVAVSHGDVIKSILADAYGMHLDLFQRIDVGPASLSIVRYGPGRPTVHATNTDAGDLSWLATSAAAGDAPVGGGAGHSTP